MAKWQPGVSGNPSGKPSTKALTDALKIEIAATAEQGADHHALRRIARKVLDLAYEGEQWAVTTVWDRLEGKPAQTLNVDQTITNLSREEWIARVRELEARVIDGVAVTVVPQLEDET